MKIRYTDDLFDPNTQKSTVIDFKTKRIKLEKSQENVLLSIWDTAGSEKYKSMAKIYLKNAQGILLCFDITNRESFEELNNFWFDLINEYYNLEDNNNSVRVLYLIGTKFDLCEEDENNRVVSESDADKMATKFNGKYFESSSKTGYNVEHIFTELAEDIYEQECLLSSEENVNDKPRDRLTGSFKLNKSFYSTDSYDKDDVKNQSSQNKSC